MSPYGVSQPTGAPEQETDDEGMHSKSTRDNSMQYFHVNLILFAANNDDSEDSDSHDEEEEDDLETMETNQANVIPPTPDTTPTF